MHRRFLWVSGEMRDPRDIQFTLLPDLASFDFIHKFKNAMQVKRFEAVSSIQRTVMSELKVTRKEAFSRAFNSLYERCKHCAEVGGECTERIFF
jgi:hypothetical protein